MTTPRSRHPSCLSAGAWVFRVPHGVADESAEIVEREGVELVFEPEDAEALREGLLRLERDHSLYERLKARGIPTSLASITELRDQNSKRESPDSARLTPRSQAGEYTRGGE